MMRLGGIAMGSLWRSGRPVAIPIRYPVTAVLVIRRQKLVNEVADVYLWNFIGLW